MERRTHGPGRTPDALTIDAVAGVRAVRGFADEPLVLGYHPHFTTNPYQALLYSRARDHGIVPVAIDQLQQLAELGALQQAGLATVLHLHWLHLVLRDATSATDAERRAARFLDEVDAYRAAGGRLVWTVHNILPHESQFEAAEARLSDAVAQRSDVVHVLAAGTPEYVAPYFTLPPERVLHVPHPSYDGAYEDHISRLESRHQLGLLPDDFVFCVVGAMRPYKGLGWLLDVWQSLSQERPMRLVLAGAPSEDPGMEAFLERAALDPNVLIDARKIPAPEMQLFMRSADVAILPYLRSLNSGALLLALTFGLPVIVPAGGGLAEIVDEAFARTVEPGDADGLRRAISTAPTWASPAAHAAARARADAFAPAIVSEQFAVELRARLMGGSPPPARSAAPAGVRSRRGRRPAHASPADAVAPEAAT